MVQELKKKKINENILFIGQNELGLCLVRSCVKHQRTGKWIRHLKKGVVKTTESYFTIRRAMCFLFVNSLEICGTLDNKSKFLSQLPTFIF